MKHKTIIGAVVTGLITGGVMLSLLMANKQHAIKPQQPPQSADIQSADENNQSTITDKKQQSSLGDSGLEQSSELPEKAMSPAQAVLSTDQLAFLDTIDIFIGSNNEPFDPLRDDARFRQTVTTLKSSGPKAVLAQIKAQALDTSNHVSGKQVMPQLAEPELEQSEQIERMTGQRQQRTETFQERLAAHPQRAELAGLRARIDQTK
ncbi:MAG: hypothetical protein DHS20C01_18060 [marine bacterium B5-7]|nr:MAG: hypothetical protein DHS20C01_18060 [marine bacterium B5-7]